MRKEKDYKRNNIIMANYPIPLIQVLPIIMCYTSYVQAIVNLLRTCAWL